MIATTTPSTTETRALRSAVPSDLRGLAESRGVPLVDALRAAHAGRLSEIVRLPVRPDLPFLVTGSGREWRRADLLAWERLTASPCWLIEADR